MTPKYYFRPIEPFNYKGATYDSILAIASGSQFLLGGTFLKNYYSIHDNTNSRIGFAPSKTSTARIDSTTPVPTKRAKPDVQYTIFNYLLVYLIEVATFAAVFTGYYYLFYAGLIDWADLLGKEQAKRKNLEGEKKKIKEEKEVDLLEFALY